MLTAQTVNPTTDNALRLIAALGIKLEPILPPGERIKLVNAAASSVCGASR
ncbi:MAG: hypothetical protein ACRDL5_12225 [Solirubrobacteraceae bacterium]